MDRCKQLEAVESQSKDQIDRVEQMGEMVDKLAKEIDYEKMKNVKIVKENVSLRKQLEELKKEISGENHPKILKQKHAELSSKIAEANRFSRE